MNKRKKGRYYEGVALKYLEEMGLTFLERNVMGTQGEIDLIFMEGDTIIFVEVKYRSTGSYGYGAEAVDRRKAERIYLTALEYIERKKLFGLEVRFDLVSFLGEELEWTRNIIWGDSFGF